jgi:hypothetical protein
MHLVCEDKTDDQPAEAAMESVNDELNEIIKTTEAFLLNSTGASSPDDIKSMVTLIYALSHQALQKNKPLAIESDEAVDIDNEELQNRKALRAVSIMPGALPHFRNGWRVEFCRHKCQSGAFSIYAQYRRGIGSQRECEYIGTVYSAYERGRRRK